MFKDQVGMEQTTTDTMYTFHLELGVNPECFLPETTYIGTSEFIAVNVYI